MLTNCATSASDKAELVAMTTLALHNLVRSKSRESSTPQGSVDEIQRNGSLLQGELHGNYITNLDRVAVRKQLECQKKFKHYYCCMSLYLHEFLGI